MKDMTKKITLLCSICENDQFSPVDDTIEDIMEASDDIEIKCSDCGRVVTKEIFLEENSEVIDAQVEVFKDEAVKEIEKELNKIFK